MIIDLILDRKDGFGYNARQFYNDCMDYCEIFNFDYGIPRALDGWENEDVQRELCKYIIENDYNPAICEYVNSVDWLHDEEKSIVSEHQWTIDAYLNEMLGCNI